jgi:hypothetical protein
MSKKRLLALPIVAIVVALFGVSVMAASPCSGSWHVHDKDNIHVNQFFIGESKPNPNLDLSTVSGLKEAVEAKGIDLSRFTFKAAFDVKRDERVEYDLAGRNSHTVLFDVTVAAGQHVIVIHEKATNSYDFAIDEYNEGLVCISGVTSFSPFYVYVGAPATSPQTGDFAPAYIAMISVALISCGAIFAIRAKKATK